MTHSGTCYGSRGFAAKLKLVHGTKHGYLCKEINIPLPHSLPSYAKPVVTTVATSFGSDRIQHKIIM